MSKLVLLWLTFAVSIIFLLVPNNDLTVGYLFSDRTVSLEYYIYSLCEKLTILLFCYIIANEATEYRFALWVFFWLMFADFVDYIAYYNEVWFNIGWVPVSMNTTKVFIFGLVILKELWNKSLK